MKLAPRQPLYHKESSYYINKVHYFYKKIYMKRFKHAAFIALLLIFASCEKKWKQPVTVNLEFETVQTLGSVDFNDGSISVNEIQFSSSRKQAEDVAFERDEDVSINMPSGSFSTPVSFELPQGTYTQMKLNLVVENDSGPGIILKGNYAKQGQQVIPVQIEINSSQLFQLIVKENDGTNEIVLIKDAPRALVITMNLEFLLTDISIDSWQNADMQNTTGIPAIIINTQNNPTIYNSIISRLNGSFQAQFK